MSRFFKIFILAVSVISVIVVGCVVYRMYFQFDAKSIRGYINDEASKYTDKATAYCLIHEMVMHILSSHNLSRSVIRMAKYSKIDVEQELVATAIAECKALKYIPE